MLQRFWFALSAIVFFFAYGGGRTMYEAIGLTAGGFWSGLVVVSLLLLLLVSINSLFYLLRERQPRLLRMVSPYGLAALIGIAVSEATVSADELAFKKEVSTLAVSGEAHYRNRAWPNETGQLCWSGARGFWSTD